MEFVINDWVHVSSGFVLENGKRMVKQHKNGVTIVSKEEFLYKYFMWVSPM